MPDSRPIIFIVLGITEEPSVKRILPALLNLYAKDILPDDFLIIGLDKSILNREELRAHIRESLNIRSGIVREEYIKHFIDHIEYEAGDLQSAEAYHRISERMRLAEIRFEEEAHRLFCIATSAHLHEEILGKVFDTGLWRRNESKNQSWTRILLDNPFSTNAGNTARMNNILSKMFMEEQIFRVNNFLAKEAVQNIFHFRFNNYLFESVWNYKNIDKIHIRIFEKADLSRNAKEYDSFGAIKDICQRNILQILATVAMEMPIKFDTEQIRRERAKVLNKLVKFTPSEVAENVIRARYTGYESEKSVLEFSNTETYFLIKCFINNGRFKNIPIFLESGKAMKERRSDVSIYFKEEIKNSHENIVTFRIYPDNEIRVKFWSKIPGFENESEAKTMLYRNSDGISLEKMIDSYDRIMYDSIFGDQTLFMSYDELVHISAFISSIFDNLNKTPLLTYEKGSMGPLS